MKIFKGVASLKFFWNGTPIEPLRLQTGLPNAEACSLPLGWSHSACNRESGFLAEIDTTLLPNGPGTLGLVATDYDGWASKHELNVTIDNRGGSAERPGSGHR